jgi:hypothetical protein
VRLAEYWRGRPLVFALLPLATATTAVPVQVVAVTVFFQRRVIWGGR